MHIASPQFPGFFNFLTISYKTLTNFSCNIIYVTFFFAHARDMVGFFQDLAIVILAPSKIKKDQALEVARDTIHRTIKKSYVECLMKRCSRDSAH